MINTISENEERHWVYNIVPRHRRELIWYKPWKCITWALLGNDDDGPMGTGPKSGRKWLQRWGATYENGVMTNPGELSFKRFCLWNLRNPLHNFTFYVIGFAWMQNVPLYQVLLVTSQEVQGPRRLRDRNIFPMRDATGIYFGIHILPCISFRIHCGRKRLEGYFGWRTRGQFGIACRIKRLNPQHIYATSPL